MLNGLEQISVLSLLLNVPPKTLDGLIIIMNMRTLFAFIKRFFGLISINEA